MEMQEARTASERDVNARYLLGQLSEDEMVALEERYFADENAYKDLLAAETDLLDEYCRGELYGADRQAFERLLRASPALRSRVSTAAVLDQGLSPSSQRAETLSRWSPLAIAAVV